MTFYDAISYRGGKRRVGVVQITEGEMKFQTDWDALKTVLIEVHDRGYTVQRFVPGDSPEGAGAEGVRRVTPSDSQYASALNDELQIRIGVSLHAKP